MCGDAHIVILIIVLKALLEVVNTKKSILVFGFAMAVVSCSVAFTELCFLNSIANRVGCGWRTGARGHRRRAGSGGVSGRFGGGRKRDDFGSSQLNQFQVIGQDLIGFGGAESQGARDQIVFDFAADDFGQHQVANARGTQ